MKKTFTQLFFGLLCISSSVFAQVPTNGLVAYYPFNGNAKDESGNGNNGTVHGATLTTDRKGKANSAYYFDGISNYIFVGNAQNINNSNYTYSVWVKASTDKMCSFIMELGTNTSHDGQSLAINNNYLSTSGWSVNSENSDLTRINFQTGTVPSSEAWYNVVTTRNDSAVKLYINGQLIKTQAVNGKLAGYTNPLTIFIGARTQLHPDYFFDGTLDEVRIYNRALNVNEIQALSADQVDLNSGLVAYYPFNGNAKDESGNGNNGTVHGATLTTDKDGKANSAYSFDGISNYIFVGNAQNINNKNYTYSFWIKANTKKMTSYIMELGTYQTANSSYNYGQGLAVSNDYLSTSGWSVNSENNDYSRVNFQTGTVPTSDTWYNVVNLRNDTSVQIYINGQFIESHATNGKVAGYSSPLDIYIGARKQLSSDFFLDGTLDEVRIYNRALNVNEIQALSADQVDINSGLVAYYPFNGNAKDESGNGNNGTVHGATLCQDRFGHDNSAYSFNGVDNYILSPNVFDLKNRSISVWFMATSSDQKLIYCYDNTGLKYGFDHLELIKNGSKDQLVFKTCDGVQRLYLDITLNQWHHAVTVFEDGVTKFYLDGSFVGQFSYDTYYTSQEGVENFIFGCSRLLNNEFFKGIIDEVRIYNRALNTKEVSALYYSSNKHIVADDVSATQGSTIVVPISTDLLLSTDNIKSFKFNVSYDATKLKFIDNVINGTISQGGIDSVYIISPGSLSVIYSNSNVIKGSGCISNLQFKVLGTDTTHVNISSFFYNNIAISNIKSSLITIAKIVAPAAKLTFSQSNGIMRYADNLLVTAAFTKSMRSNPLPKIRFSGAVSVSASVMTRVNDSVFTFKYVIPKAKGTVKITLSAGLDLLGNKLDSIPVTGKSFTILPITYGDVDDNGQITAYDAAIVLQNLIGASSIIPLPWSLWRNATANVDNVGAITANDAALILKYSTNTISSFPSNQAKSAMVNPADVAITVENNALVFRSNGNLFGLNLFMTDSNKLLGKPEVLNDSMISSISIIDNKYSIGLATAIAPKENSIFMKIPLKSKALGNISFKMLINTTSVTKSIAITTAISVKENGGLRIYPNPVGDVLNIEMPSGLNNANISVYSIDGRLVLVQQLKSTEGALTVSSLPKGVYTVVLTGANATYTQKFIKK